MLGNRRAWHGSMEMTILNGCPMSQMVWHAKEPSLLNSQKCRAQVKIWSPSPVKVTSSYEWKILEWDVKHQTNKQNKHSFVFTNLREDSNFCSPYWSEISSLCGVTYPWAPVPDLGVQWGLGDEEGHRPLPHAPLQLHHYVRDLHDQLQSKHWVFTVLKGERMRERERERERKEGL